MREDQRPGVHETRNEEHKILESSFNVHNLWKNIIKTVTLHIPQNSQAVKHVSDILTLQMYF